MEAQTGRRPPDLDTPKLPPECVPIWRTFIDLNRRRSSDCGIPYTEIHAHGIVTGVRLKSWEIDALDRLDSVWAMVKVEVRNDRHR